MYRIELLNGDLAIEISGPVSEDVANLAVIVLKTLQDGGVIITGGGGGGARIVDPPIKAQGGGGGGAR